MTRSVFDPVAQRYDASRPDYPTGLYDAIDRLAGPLAGAAVVEVGAGTGIATRGLTARGARVLAVEVGAAMLARLRERSPGLPAVVGDGAALPVRDDAADVVAYAQSFHWLPLLPALAEARRVLRPGGALALWWNASEATDEAWMRLQSEAFRDRPSGYAQGESHNDVEENLRATGLLRRIEHVDVYWERRQPIEDHLGYVGSKSAVVLLGPGAEAFLAQQRRLLEASFPDGVVVEPFRCTLTLAWPA